MAEPAHLTLARSLIGKIEDGPQVPQLAMEIAQLYPDMAAYCAQARSTTSWCGIFIAVCLLRSYGVRPPFDPGDELKSFMWVDGWAEWGAPVSDPQPGDILLFRSPHHITFFVASEGDRCRCIGGNQSDGVTETTFAKSGLRAIRRAGAVNAQPSQAPLRPAVSNFDKCLPLLLEHEGGNNDDPRDPGGRTSRGILQREWDVWRQTHPGLPSDVWQAPQDQVAAIYREQYWDAMSCDDLPSGVDYTVFDYGVNSGIGRAAKVLQRLVIPQEVDGEIGPNTIAATANVIDPKMLVSKICDERLAFLQGLSTWSTFGNGWSTRVREVRAASLEMAATPKPTGTPMPKASEPISGQILLPGQPIGQPQFDLRPLLEALLPLLPALLQAIQQVKAGQPVTLPPVAQPASQPASTAAPASGSPGGLATGVGIAGLLAGMIGQGATGTPFGFGQNPDLWGTVAAVAGAAAPFVGYAGGFGPFLKAGLTLFSAIGNAASKATKTT